MFFCLDLYVLDCHESATQIRNDENLTFCHSERNERSECSEESKSHGVLFLDSRGLDTSLQATLFAQYDNKSVDCFGESVIRLAVTKKLRLDSHKKQSK